MVRRVFAWGKHLVFQFDGFALRVHFMLWGTFAATVRGRVGDRRLSPERRAAAGADVCEWRDHDLELPRCATSRAAMPGTDTISPQTCWPTTGTRAPRWRRRRAFPDAEIADVLLDQAIFGGVGNIIKNEVLFRTA